MKRTLVLYYSKTGSNRFLAENISRELTCDIEKIRPRFNAFPFLALFGAVGISAGSGRLKHDPGSYERIVLVGPVWMGQVISPLRDMLKKALQTSAELVYVTCCGSDDKKKDETFGYGGVFKKLEAMTAPKTISCHAFSIMLVVPEDKKGDDQAVMKTRLTQDNFTGEIKTRFDALIDSLRT